MLERIFYATLGMSIAAFGSQLLDMLGIDTGETSSTTFVFILIFVMLITICLSGDKALRIAAFCAGTSFTIMLFGTTDQENILLTSYLDVVRLVFGMITGVLALMYLRASLLKKDYELS